MADDKNQSNRGNESQNRPGHKQEQQRRDPGSEQQGGKSNQPGHNVDREREERERKRA